MGAQASSLGSSGSTATAATANDADAFRRAWREGVPFTLLHDEAFVAEKYQEISAAKSATGEKDAEPDDVQVISGVNGVPMDELEQVADLARIKLFSKRRKPQAAGAKRRNASSLPSSNGSSEGSSTSHSGISGAESDQVSSVLAAEMTDKILSRESAESRASERLRKQRVEIVEHYFAQLAERLRSAHDPRVEESDVAEQEADAATLSLASSRLSVNHLSSWDGSPAGVFSVTSFRVQLEMLREFRKALPRLFESSVLTIVQTLLDFPAFALQSGSSTRAEQALITDTHDFCRSILGATDEDLPASQRQVTLLLLLAFGVSSGRVSLLLDFTEGLLLGSGPTTSNELLRDRTFVAWVDVMVTRLESFRIDYALGTLEEDTLVKQFPIKLVASENETSESDKLPRSESIATDGSFVYTWSLQSGLLKIGTGLNFTIAGRVYAESGPSQYTQAFERQRVFRAALCGSGRIVTDVVSSELLKTKAAEGDSPGKNVQDVLATGDLDDLISAFLPRRLFVLLSVNGIKKSIIVRDEDQIELVHSQLGEEAEGLNIEDGSIRLLSAFYGDFEVLQEEGMDRLRRKFQVASTSAQDADESSLTLSEQMLADLLPGSSKASEISDSTELIVFYSAEGEEETNCHSFRVGDQISEVEEKGSNAYASSMVLCGDSLYLSFLCSDSDTIASGNTKQKKQSRAPRRLLRVSPQDLGVIGIHTLNGDGSAARSPPLKSFITYATEGLHIYEVEMSADRFNVQAFAPRTSLNGSMNIEFVKSFAIDVNQLQCPRFVSYFLSFLSAELNVPDGDFALPAIYTNGKWLGIVVPPANQLSEKSHCVVVDCEKGAFVEEASGGKEDTASKLPRCHEHVVPGRLLCFDAKNNLVWTLNSSKGSLAYFRNPGKRISLSHRTPAAQILDQARRQIDASEEDKRVDQTSAGSSLPFEISVGARILGFLSENAEASEPSEWTVLLSSNNACGPAVVPFVADLRETSFKVLLKSIKQYAEPFQASAASIVQSYCLQACISILNANVTLLLRAQRDKNGGEILKLLRADLSPLLNGLIHASTDERDDEPELPESPSGTSMLMAHGEQHERSRLEVISRALDLYATCTNIFHPNVMKQFEGVLKYLKLWKGGLVSVTELKIVGRLIGHLSNRVDDLQLALLESTETFETLTKLIGHAVAIQKQKLKNIFAPGDSLSGASALNDEDALVEVTLLINSVSQSLFLSMGTKKNFSVEQSLLVLSLYRTLCDGCDDICSFVAASVPTISNRKVWTRAEKFLRRSFFGVLSPMLLSSGLVFLRTHDLFFAMAGAKDGDRSSIHTMQLDFLKENAQKMSSMLKALETIGTLIDPAAKQKTVESVVAESRLETMESAHEYENNQDTLQELRISGATRIIVTFDSRSRTETNYDYVTFYKDQLKQECYGEAKYSGRDAEYNWPGVGTNPPLVIESDHCFVAFHSDQSNTDWGFKFTARGEILKKKMSVKRHWLVFLTEAIVQVLDESMKIFVDASVFSPIDEAELLNERFLQSDLVKGGVFSDQNQNTNVLQLLKDFANPPANSRAEKVVNALMSRNGMQRQRTSFSSSTSEPSANQNINSAVRAVAAAILHHNMWGMDAYAFAEDLRNDVSNQLLRGWKNAQKMRDWFHLGDAADAGMQRQGSRKLRRQPSAFKGISEESLRILCDNVMGRARFLLELTPASFSYVSSAKRRWGLLAKYGHAIGKMGTSESAIDKWYNLLDELQAATELRSLFQYRRNSSERMRGGQTKSVTEQVLEFIQSDVDIDELRRVITTRNVRASSRAFGMDLFVETWGSCPSLQLKATLVESFAVTLKKMAQISPSSVSPNPVPAMIHFAAKLSGCQQLLRHQVMEAFGKCLREFASMLNSIPLDNASCPLIVATLKSCALDYNVEDSYLLHESRILTQVLRLLSADVIQIRRAAQSVLGIFLARFVVGKAGLTPETGDQQDDNEDLLDATAFQRQLFTAVGLQLEGVVALTNASALTSPTVNDGVQAPFSSTARQHYLPDGTPGLTSPCLEKNRVSWNHSIMLWVYVHGENNVYALKVGDEVRHGPDWKEGAEDDDGGDKDVGVVSSIVHPTKIEVRWSSNAVGEYVFDPKAGIYEVLLVDQGVGGVIFYKGNKTMLKETAFAAPWSSFGLFLNDQRQLSYKISSGGDKECVYNSNYELDANEWSHVAVVQEEDTMKFFVNGVMASHHLLDPFLLMHGNVNASESKIVECVHPYPDAVDQYWPVHIPGASKIRVTFDPLCDIDQSFGYVRFYKNARCNEFWGEERYSGKYHDPERNFPGAQSQRARGRRNSRVGLNMSVPSSVEIPSDRFLVYFHNEGSSNGWGFRLLAVPEYPPDATTDAHGFGQPSRLSLNPFPFYFGEPPCRVLDESAARCTIYQPKVCDFALPESDIVSEIQGTCPGSEILLATLPSERALHTLSSLQTCCETQFGRSLIGSPENIGNLLFAALDEQFATVQRCASIAILRELVEYLSPEVAAVQLNRVFPRLKMDLTDHLLHEIGEYLNVWKLYSEDDAARNIMAEDPTDNGDEGALELRRSAQEAKSLVTGYISLLRSLAGHFNWNELIARFISKSAAELKSLDTSAGDVKSLGKVIASCALLGGTYGGITIGGRVTCCVNIDEKETVETGYLLQFRLKNGVRTAQVLFDCDKTRPIDVPMSDIAHLADEELEELEYFHTCLAPFVDDVKDFFKAVLEVNVISSDNQAKYKSKITRKEHVEVLESEHPYCNAEDVTYPLDFRGADEIVIYFDEMSCTAGPDDYVTFLKRDGHEGASKSSSADTSNREHWGEKKFFGDKFPGFGGIPPLHIPASSVDVYFHTDPSTSREPIEWGFKLTAHAFEETLSYPPEIPPRVTANVLNDIRARCLKAVSSFFQLQKSSDVVSQFASLVSPLAKIANEPSTGRPTCSTPRTQVFESKHPYTNSVLEYMEVTFSGASTLTVTFDSQCRSEKDCDYLSLFKDRTLTDRWGAYRYSGEANTANWPGTDGRPPLVIPSDSFTLFWCTDASNVDWGWKFTVTAEFKPTAPLLLSLERLDKRAYHLFEILYEKMERQRLPYPEEFEGYETTGDEDTSALHHWQDDPIRQIIVFGDDSRSPSSVGSNGVRMLQKPQTFTVIDDAGAKIYEDRAKATIVGELQAGETFGAISHGEGWLKLVSGNASSRHGWVRQRTADKLHATSTASLTRYESLLVMGVDDTRLEGHHSVLEMNESNQEQDALSSFFSQFAFESLKGQCNRFQSFAYDSHCALATKYAREAILGFVSSQSSVGAIQMSDFGDENEFLALLTHLFHRDQGTKKSDAGTLKVLESTVCRFADDSRNTVLLERTLARSLSLLNLAAELLPSERGALRVIESKHPYESKADQYWQVSVPGAQRILITCDTNSKSEPGTSWLCFYKDGSSRSEKYGEPTYGGRGDALNWPGCGGQPPLIVKADSFEAHFHSESDNSDWGFKLFAVGIFDNGEEVAVAEPKKRLKEDSKSAMLLLNVCCWLLGVLSEDMSKHDRELSKTLYSARTLETLISSLEDLPMQLTPNVLQVVINMTQNSSLFHKIPHLLVERVRDLVHLKLEVRYKAEEASASKSRHLQTLVQCALAIDLAIESGRFRQLVKSTSSLQPRQPQLLTLSKEEISTTSFEWMAEKRQGTELHQFQVLLAKVTSPFSAALWAKIDSAGDARLAIEWTEEGKIYMFDTIKHGVVELDVSASPLCAGDTVCFQPDFENYQVVLRKNGLVAGVVDVESLLGGIAGKSVLSLSSFEVHSLMVGAKTGSADDEVFGWAVAASPLALLPPCIAPSWYNKIVDSVGTMLAFHDRRSAEVVIEESVHPLSKANKLCEEVKIPGAVALEIKFDKRSKLRKADCLKFYKGGGPSAPNDTTEPANFSFTGLNGEQDHLKNPLLFLSESLKRNDLVRVGDLVVRSRDWEFGDEDGGIGSIGTVQEVVPWNKQTGAGVRVIWRATGKTHVYRCGSHGSFDVQLHSRTEYRDLPVLIPGDTLSYSFQPSAETVTSSLAFTQDLREFNGSLRLHDASLNLQLSNASSGGAARDADLTFEMWMHIGCVSSNDGASSPEIELFRLKSPDASSSLHVSTSPSGLISITLHKSDAGGQIPVTLMTLDSELANPGMLAFDQWLHFAVVLAGSKILLYQNGEICFSARWDRVQFSLHSATFLGETRLVCGRLYDLRVWNVALKAEQLKSHSKGLDTVNSHDLALPPQSPTLPGTPRSHTRPASSFLIPPSPPRSPSRSFAIPANLKKWATTNRTGKEMVSVRLNASISAFASSTESVVYYEAYPLSSGKISIGWMWTHAVPSSSEFVVGESDDSFGIEPHQRVAHFRGNTVELEPFSAAGANGLSSPRGSNGSFSSPDFFYRPGDVIGCALALKTSELLFYINGQFVARAGIQDPELNSASGTKSASDEPNEALGAGEEEATQNDFDQLVAEMCSIGFSRQSSTEAVASSDDLASSPRKRASSRSRSSSQSATDPPKLTTRDGLSPVATLSPQGVQGIVWNFGERAFKHTPIALEGQIVPVVEAADKLQEELHFEIFEPSEANWQQVAYRHKVQDIAPQMLAWWKLDEGEGATVRDASGNNNVGEIVYGTAEDGKPPSTSADSLWDQEFAPPGAGLRRNSDCKSSSPFANDNSEVDPGTVKAEQESVWGYKFYVIPHFSYETIGHERFQEHITKLCGAGGFHTEPRHDRQLVKYVNKAAQDRLLSGVQLLRANWNEIAPQEDELVRWPVLLEIATGVTPEQDNNEDGAKSSPIAGGKGVSQERLAKRFKLLQDFNSAIHRVLPFVGFQSPSALGSTSTTPAQMMYSLVSSQRHRIFNLVKRVIWDEALTRTNEKSVALELTLNRPKAMRHRSTGKVDMDGRYTLFSQAFRQLNSLSGAHYRRPDNFYHVTFLGENAQDAGGPYRETLAQYCEELHSSQLPLLLPTSNSQHNVGAGREKWVLNPGANTTTPLHMYEFLGKLMGVVLRSKQYLSLNIAAMIWKQLVGEQLHIEDLAAVDSMIVNSMHKMRTIDTLGVTEEMFEDIVLETFTTLSSDNRVVVLKPSGQSIAVTFANRCEYADLVEGYRLHEFDLQVAALYRGISTVVPAKLLSCFTGPELELMVCGSPEIDVDLLERCTEYSSCNASDTHIVWFWQVLRKFSHDERSAFLRFVWGRSRLPANEKEFPQRFKLQSFSKAQAGRSSDGYLPISHTCFFSVEMPIYSSEQVLHEKLLYAIYNCQEIDGDGDAVAANQLGWEE
ncbi:Hect e3 ubiquitin ligase [Globisporangium polare]